MTSSTVSPRLTVVRIEHAPCPDCDGRGYLDPRRETGPFYIHVRRGGLPSVPPRQEGRRLYRDEFSWQEDRRSPYDEVNARMKG